MSPAQPEPGLPDPGTVAQTVTEFTRRIKRLIEGGIGSTWIRGEVSNLRAQSSGHIYFSLKDAGAQLPAVLFKGDAGRQSVRMRDGMQVVALGQLSVFEPHGKYQLIVRTVIEDGVGRLQREFEALKRKLGEEGLFAPERKRAIPAMPGTIGFVTSPSGAAVQDFIRILQRRGWRGRLVILPAKVQGAEAAAEVAAQVEFAARLGLFDLLVVGRGGGSIEDLWAFNEEVLVRAVAASPIPVISAVGHEIDFTLCDLAADLRAETPSGAAELISSHWVKALERTAAAASALTTGVDQAVRRARERVAHAASRLRLLTPAAQVERGYLRLDDFSNRLRAALQASLHGHRHRLARVGARLERASPETRVRIESHRLLSLWKRLQAASPASVLNRGFAIIRDENGAPVLRRAGVGGGRSLGIEFADGRLPVRSEDPGS